MVDASDSMKEIVSNAMALYYFTTSSFWFYRFYCPTAINNGREIHTPVNFFSNQTRIFNKFLTQATPIVIHEILLYVSVISRATYPWWFRISLPRELRQDRYYTFFHKYVRKAFHKLVQIATTNMNKGPPRMSTKSSNKYAQDSSANACKNPL